MDLNRDLTLWTYQGTDGSNQSTLMCNYKWNTQKNISFILGAGLDTNWEKTGFIADGKVHFELGKNTIFQLRAITRNGEDYNKLQTRIALCENFEVAKGTSIYATAYGALNIDCNDGKLKPHAGCFVGVDQKIGKHWSVGAEVQRYNLQDITEQDGNWSINGKIAYKF